MSYVVLARKWRPQSFQDLIGQEHVSTTIGNAIAQNRVAHAFLFTGVRGVGKTTSARILAKALNCATGPTATPCQVCAQCVEITAGRDMDVQEIDGASYTGVDDVRRLQSNLGPQPSRDRFKIFIVDEVHMLSNNAWNAFLKTLEEPPPHVKFIFATTEVHKVPVTILSRCQRYDFKMIAAQMIAGRLRFVLDQEGIGAEDGAVSAIAREAAGSMRDGMSLLDQVIAWVGPGEKLTAEGVARVLGIADRVVLHRLAEAVLDGNAGEAVRIVGDLAREGYDLPHVARDFLSHLRDLVIAKVSENPAPLLDLADEEIGDVKALAARSGVDDLTRLHQGFSKSFDDVVRSGQPRASLEMTLVRLARRPPLLPVDELLRRLGDLERRLGGGGGGPSGSPGAPQNRGPAPGGAGGPPPGGQQRRQYGGGAGATNEASPSAPIEPPPVAAAPPPPAPVAVSAPPTAAAPAPYAAPLTFTAPPAAKAPSAAPAPFAPPTAAPNAAVFTPPASTRPTPPPPQPLSTSPAGRPAVNGGIPASQFIAPTNQQAPLRPSAPPPPAFMTKVEAAPARFDFDVPAWRSVLDRIRGGNSNLAVSLELVGVMSFTPERVELGYEAHEYHLIDLVTEASARETLGAALRAHFGRSPELVFTTTTAKSGTVSQVLGAEKKAKLDASRRGVAEHPSVTAAIELLGAELRDVKLAAEAES